MRSSTASASPLDRGLKPDGLAIDTWGVDFALIGGDGKLLERPRHYRDSRNAAALKEMLQIVPAGDIFGYTGIQHMQINTLVQLFAMRLHDRDLLSSARYLVNIPDLFNYLLTGVAKSEATIASTTQFFNPVQMSWATELLKRLDLPTELLCPDRPARHLHRQNEGFAAYLRLRHRRTRHGIGRCGGARGGRQELVLHQLRDLVAGGSGTGSAGD